MAYAIPLFGQWKTALEIFALSKRLLGVSSSPSFLRGGGTSRGASMERHSKALPWVLGLKRATNHSWPLSRALPLGWWGRQNRDHPQHGVSLGASPKMPFQCYDWRHIDWSQLLLDPSRLAGLISKSGTGSWGRGGQGNHRKSCSPIWGGGGCRWARGGWRWRNCNTFDHSHHHPSVKIQSVSRIFDYFMGPYFNPLPWGPKNWSYASGRLKIGINAIRILTQP